MKQFKNLRIVKLAVYGLRSFKNTEITFDDRNFLTGDNTKGKTSIAHAICFALYGITYMGETSIEQIMQKSANYVEVTLTLMDIEHNGEAHELCRRREKKSKSATVTFDGLRITQSDINTYFCDAKLFLSIFNPTYFAEHLTNESKNLLFRLIPNIKYEEIIDLLPAEDIEIIHAAEFTTPEAHVFKCQKRIEEIDGELLKISGKDELLQKQQKSISCDEINEELSSANEQYEYLCKKRYQGVDLDKLYEQKNELEQNIKEQEALMLFNENYLSKYSAYMIASKEYKDAKSFAANINADNASCPCCGGTIVPQIKEHVQNHLKQRIAAIISDGQRYRNEMEKAKDEKSLAYEKYCKYTDMLAKVNKKLEVGALSPEEFYNLRALNDFIDSFANKKEQYDKGVSNDTDEIKQQKAMLEKERNDLSNEINSFSRLISKRNEVILSNFNMENTSFILSDKSKSSISGKETLQIIYQGRAYKCLSSSERIRAGLEISALLRTLSGLDYPVFIDNAESITSISSRILPSQTFISKVVSKSELEIKTIHASSIPNNKVSIINAAPTQSIDKAG